MKIKEVIKETGLTDRAIRLYIENDLVKPECDENYNGRKSIVFSETDVANLKNIALLRKADFSIQEIKALQMGGETAQQTVKDYIKRTNEKIQFNTEIIEKIGALADEENITIEVICEKLSSNLENENVPAEDMELSPKERREKIVFTVVSVIGMAFSLVLSVYVIYFQLNFYKFPHPKPLYKAFEIETLHDVPLLILFIVCKCFFVIQFVLCFAIGLLYKHKIVNYKRKDKRKRKAIILTIIWGASLLLLPFTILVNIIPTTYSQTDNPNNYLEIDRDLDADIEAIYEVFPTNIPNSVIAEKSLLGDTDKYLKETQYYYLAAGGLFDYKYDIFAQWQLTDRVEYDSAKEETIEDMVIVYEEKKGDWHCVYSEKDDKYDGKNEYYYFLIFAYNDKTQTVRYVFAQGSDYYNREPYYLTQEW